MHSPCDGMAMLYSYFVHSVIMVIILFVSLVPPKLRRSDCPQEENTHPFLPCMFATSTFVIGRNRTEHVPIHIPNTSRNIITSSFDIRVCVCVFVCLSLFVCLSVCLHVCKVGLC